MSRDPRYQRLLNDRRWRELRIAYLREHPLCERCIREGKAAGVPEGYITPAIDVHHRVPVETAKTLQEMERLAYDWNNLEALCIPCHSRTHRDEQTTCRPTLRPMEGQPDKTIHTTKQQRQWTTSRHPTWR